MNQSGERDREIPLGDDRALRLCDATLKINESLDFDSVLQQVANGSGSLTLARHGMATLLDESGGVRDIRCSCATAEGMETRCDPQAWTELLESLATNSGPLMLPDLRDHIASLGLTRIPASPPISPGLAFLAVPMLRLGKAVGNIYVIEKEGGGNFSDEDQEMLTTFAPQAAMSIANAVRHRSEHLARAHLETLLDRSPVGVTVFDARTGAPVSFNQEATRIVAGLRLPDQSTEELVSSLLVRCEDELVIPLRELPFAQAINAGETVQAREIILEAPDGGRVPALVSATPIETQSGEISSYVVTMQDLTPMKELERLRAELLAIVSHELSLPLTSIKGSVTNLLDPEVSLDPAEVVQFHRIIDTQVNQMRSLISDLHDVARVETGTFSVVREPASMADVLDEARNAFLSGGFRGDLRMELAPNLPIVMADRRRIGQVMSNLLSNADKYSPAGSPIRVAAITNEGHMAVSVADEGMGLSADQITHLFTQFSGIDAEERRDDSSGSGLGLAICRGIVEAHGGTIWAESDGPGLGARFTFTLPVAESVSGGVAAESALPYVRSHPEQGALVRILAVDDDPQMLRHVRDSLSAAGFSALVTSDPQEVPRLIVEEKPDLVLLDLMLPGSDGMDLMKEIVETEEVPVIFLSAYGQEHIIARALDLGATDYVVKPFSPTELAARIRTALRKHATIYQAEPTGHFSLGDLHIDYAERRVTVSGEQVRLTVTEYELLYLLSMNAGRVLTHTQLMQQVWGHDRFGEPSIVRNLVKRIRGKLRDDAQNPTYIFTEPRVGYRMARGGTSAI